MLLAAAHVFTSTRIGDKIFYSAEQYYQTCKAFAMRQAEPREVVRRGRAFSSHQLVELTMETDGPSECAEVGRLFDHLKEDDPECWAS